MGGLVAAPLPLSLLHILYILDLLVQFIPCCLHTLYLVVLRNYDAPMVSVGAQTPSPRAQTPSPQRRAW